MLAKNHFEDCPYGCNSKGLLLDVDKGTMIPCPHCSKRKKELLAQGYVEVEDDSHLSLGDALGIESEYLSTKFVYDSVVPDGERLFIEEESLKWQSEVAEELYLNLTVGEIPKESLCFGISVKGRIDRFVYPMLAKAYLANVNIGKFISCTEFNLKAFNMDSDIKEYYNCDLLFMLINDGSNLADIASAKGLMQVRATKGKPTIFITTWTIEACSGLLGFSGESSLYMAKPVFVKYKSSKKKQSSYINNLLGVENERVTEQTKKDSKNKYTLSMAELGNF